MDSNQPRRAGTAFEYFLYAAILGETALASVIYKAIFGSGELMHLRIYFAIFYFAFLGWCIAQLNKLHRARNAALPDLPSPADPATNDTTPGHTRPALGLTRQQLAIVVVVFAMAIATFSWALRFLG